MSPITMLFYSLILSPLVIFGVMRFRRNPCVLQLVATLVWTTGLALLTCLMLAPTAGVQLFGLTSLFSCWLFFDVTLLLAIVAIICRQKPRRKTAAVSVVLLVALLAAGIDGFLIEPEWLEVTHYTIRDPRITEPMTIAIVADLQTDNVGDYERRVFQQLWQQEPDVVLFAGDYVQEHDPERRADTIAEMTQLLAQQPWEQLDAAYAVNGNVDHSDWIDLFRNSPGVNTVEQSATFSVGPVDLTCLTNEESGSRSKNMTVARPSDDRLHIVLGHRPDFARSPNIDADLLLAGHVHGGQVRLPIIGPLMTMSRIPKEWTTGLHTTPGGGQLLVSRGIGRERGNAPQVRFLCRPELAVIHIVPGL